MTRILCLGDVGVDIFDREMRPGGCSLNVLMHLLQNSIETFEYGILGLIGSDDQSKIIKNALSSVKVNNHLITLNFPTTQCFIENRKNGERVFIDYQAPLLENFNFNNSHLEIINHYDVVITLFFKQIEPLFRSLIKLPINGRIFCDSTDLRDYPDNPKVVEEFISYLEGAFFGLQKNQIKIIEWLEQLSKKTNKLVVITLGEDGALAIKGDEKVFAPSIIVEKVIDTTGAGDSFLATFLFHYLQDRPLLFCLQKAHLYAAKIVQRLGAF